MVATVARRTLAGLAVVVGAVTLTFFLVRLAPGDPVERLLGPQAPAAQLAAQRHAPGLDWLPAFGAAGLDADVLTGWSRRIDEMRHLALPLTTLTLIGVGGTARFARGAMRDVRSQPFVQTAQAKGLSPWQVTHRHVARNALIPVITLLGLSLPALFSSAVLVEAVFAWPGMGRRLVEAVQARDYPVVMAATTVSAILVVLGNLLADAGVAWIDPRVRHGTREGGP